MIGQFYLLEFFLFELAFRRCVGVFLMLRQPLVDSWLLECYG